MTEERPVLVRKPLTDILLFFRPGSHDWSWSEEYHDLISRDAATMSAIRRRVDAEGIGFADESAPITLGHDKRVWDGHHRICLAAERQESHLMVKVVPPKPGDPAPERSSDG